MKSILTNLDIELQNFYIKNHIYPKQILVNKEIKDKIFKELEKEPINLDNSWVDKKNNYKGIPLKIRKDIEFIKLEE